MTTAEKKAAQSTNRPERFEYSDFASKSHPVTDAERMSILNSLKSAGVKPGNQTGVKCPRCGGFMRFFVNVDGHAEQKPELYCLDNAKCGHGIPLFKIAAFAPNQIKDRELQWG